MFDRIVVPLDGSAIAEQALGHAVNLASATGKPLHLVRVVDISGFDPYGTRTVGEAEGVPELAAAEADAERYLRSVGQRVAGRGIDPSIEVRRGWIVDELRATVVPGDLVVMASQGHGFIERRIFGSVTEAMLKHSPVPVVFVRVTEEAP